MDTISIFIVLLPLMFVPDAIGRQCSIDKYVLGDGCVPCPACPAGTQYTSNCGYDREGRRTAGAKCETCQEGRFKDKISTGQCKNCQLCEKGKVTKAPCTSKSDTVCECPKGMYDDYGVCRRIPTTAPVTSPVMSPPVTTSTRTTTTQASTRIIEPKQNGTQQPSATVFYKSDKSPGVKPEAQRKVNPDGSFPKPGWIVFFCLLGSLIVIAFVFMSCHKRTRKQISGFFCRKYRVLWPDHDSDRETTSGFLTVEDHYEEQQVANPTNYATPIPPWEEPVPPIVQSSTTSEQVYCNCESKDVDDEKMQCSCALSTSDPSIGKMAHTSSSAETISEELQYYCYGKRPGKQTPARKSSPSPSNSSGVFPSRPPDHQCHLLSPCVTPAPRGLSPDHCCVTSPSPSSSSSCVTPRGRSPDNYCVTSSSSSTCETPPPPRGLSPDHRCMTSSSSSYSPGATPRGWSPETTSSSSTCATPLRGRSPDPSSLPSIQIDSEFSKEQEISNQSNECLQTPISIEAHDKEHDVIKAPRKVSSSPPPGKRNTPSPKKDPLRVCKHELYPKDHWPTDPDHCKETAGKERDAPQVPTSDKDAQSDIMTTVGNDIEVDEIGRLKTNLTVNNRHVCMYRPINRSEAEHRCQECSPQPGDSFFQLINRERLCLKKETCKELNGSYKELAILGRVESEMKEYEASSNPAERVLDRLNASYPGLKLQEFEQMLRQIKRLDIVNVIHNHHLSCTFCQRNRFDTKV